jgi:serine/threonine protein kinase
LPPETFKAFKYTHKSEVFALGCLFHEILFLELPGNNNNNNTKPEQSSTHLLADSFPQHKLDHIVEGMLNAYEMNRPSTADLLKFLMWQESIVYVSALEKKKRKARKSSLSSPSFLDSSCFNVASLAFIIQWKQRNAAENSIYNKTFVLKQFVLGLNKSQILQEKLPTLLKSKLDHENLLSVNSFLLFNARLLIISDHLTVEQEYLNLEQKLKSCKEFLSDNFTEGVIAARWLPQIVDALDYLHSKNLIHGNLKPENLFIRYDNSVKLTDFGFYHFLFERGSVGGGIEQPQSRSPENVGRTSAGDSDEISHFHESPLELTKNNFIPVDHKLDIYMLGMVLYRCLTYEDEAAREQFLDTKSSLTGSRCVVKLRKLVVNMISADPFDRPELRTVLSTLNSKIEYKFHSILVESSASCSQLLQPQHQQQQQPQSSIGNNVARVNGRVLNFFSREKDFIVVRTFRKQSFRAFIDWQCLKSMRFFLIQGAI